MKIRYKLTLLFILIVAIILVAASLSIYFFSANYRIEDFYNRLHSKASNTAQLLIQIEEVSPELLEKMERNNPYSLPNERITIYNFKNQVLYSSDTLQSLKVTADFLDQIRLHETIRFNAGDYEILGFLYKDRYDRFVVIIGATDIYGLSKLKNLRTILTIVIAISILIVSVAGWIYSGRFLKPISNFIKRADEISITSLNLRLETGNEQDEMTLLAKTFNVMLDRLEGSFEIQKNFIANASHEIRNPLTSITGQLEVTLLKQHSEIDYQDVIKSVLEDIKTLNSLTNRLLLLAQASAENKDSFTKIRIDDTLWAAKEELRKRKQDFIINIDFDPMLDDDNKLTINGDKQLIYVAIINLLENGCKYSASNSVDVYVQYYKKHITMSFFNNGIPILKEEFDTIFEPFNRGKNAQQIKGHGIGLSLVKRIIILHDGAISFRSHYGKTIFKVRLPLINRN
jgi:signal transduction histidine kinase